MNCRPDEGAAIKRVISSRGSFIPSESVNVIANSAIDNTFHQVEALKEFLEDGVSSGRYQEGDQIIFPLGPQVVRVMRFCNKLQAIPRGLQVAVFPMETPRSGFPMYPTNEIKGLIHYILNQQASRKPLPYRLYGKVDKPVTSPSR